MLQAILPDSLATEYALENEQELVGDSDTDLEDDLLSKEEDTVFAKNMTDANAERTFIAVKPDGVQRGLVGEIIKRFEQRGYKLVAGKLMVAPKALLENHYKDLADKPFYSGLVTYMASGPVFAMVWEGKEVVKMGRKMLGATNPRESAPGTIRGDYCIDVGRNICHGSDAVETAQREIALWFKDDELCDYEFADKKWVYE
ncbi:nucleoside diphosphate kinase [Elysia marginata]|uniref:Nucleoside diphosphate kinase n=1 Tax=Elysia marginata TaxID=1093978 RepID=A0AAV4GZR5_9GAST|nr:nucleoside diphosphate kinase [Elysia marginata]